MQIKNTKIIFFGTPEVSANVLENLIESDFNITAVVTNPDQPVGRKQTITPPPVKNIALKNKIEVLQPTTLKDFVLPEADLAIVVAYGKIIPQKIIDSFSKGMLNIHYSLLPKYRGASPVESAILNNENETGVTIQKLVFKLDAGAIIAQEKILIDQEITTPKLKEKLTEIGSRLLIETLPKYLSDEITPEEQDESQVTHCGKIEKANGELLPTDSENQKWLKYRAYFGWPGVFYFDSEGKRNKVTLATFENEKFVIKRIIPEGKNEISV